MIITFLSGRYFDTNENVDTLNGKNEIIWTCYLMTVKFEELTLPVPIADEERKLT